MISFCTDCTHYRQDVHEEELGRCAKFNIDVGLESLPLDTDSTDGCFEEVKR